MASDAAQAHGCAAVRIFDDPSFHWVIEIRFPLRIGRKSWGGATIGFDAAPIREEIRSLFILLFVTTMLVSGGTLVVLSLFAGRLTASLNRLVKEMDSADLVKGAARPTLRTDDDVAFLFERFDLMRHRIDQSRTQIELAQREVYQAEKLASIGRLASGVAHQVNNPLNGIRSCLYAIGKEPDNALQTKEYVDMINEEITHIETVVQKLLGFARPQMQAAGEIDIGQSTRKVVELFDVRLREKQIRLAVDLPESLPPVAIDYHLFQEVVMNLLLNGYDAVGRGGEIRVEARALDPSAVVLRVKDNGVGIPAGKPRADLRTVLHHEGDRDRDRPRAVGLPEHRGAARGEDCGHQCARRRNRIRGDIAHGRRSMNILIIEDERVSRITLTNTIRKEGFEVTSATTAEEGLQAFDAERHPVVITDLRLPEHRRT